MRGGEKVMKRESDKIRRDREYEVINGPLMR